MARKGRGPQLLAVSEADRGVRTLDRFPYAAGRIGDVRVLRLPSRYVAADFLVQANAL